jgi:predicted nucleic acid-binding protein
MILFCDTSALIKLYVVEAGSKELKRQVALAEAAAVCRVAWAEAHAALSRRAREVPHDAPLIEQAKTALAKDWPRFVVMEVNQALVERAGEYADAFALRGYDSIQLAAAYEAGRISGLAVLFASFDSRLNKAARLLEMQCL